MITTVAFTQEALSTQLQNYGKAKRWLVGFSGGLDSSVLLHALVQWRASSQWPGPELLAIHVNHGLSADAGIWQHHCEETCRQWDVQFETEVVEVSPRGEGLEAAAREARYHAFTKYLRPGDVLLTAHHQDDQAETLLLRLLRGAGGRGLAAMAKCRALGVGQIVRPLLGFSRQHLADYARLHGLAYQHDDSNAKVEFDRNYLRHQILPQLEQRWPNLARRWARTARILGENETALSELAAMDLATCGEQAARVGWCLNWRHFCGLSAPRRHNLIRYWCEQRNLPLPEDKHLRQADEACNPASNIAPDVQWRGGALRSYADKLYLLPARDLASPVDSLPPVALTGREETVVLPDQSCLMLSSSPSGGLRPDLGPLTVRWRTGGERCRPYYRQRSQSLKKCLQEFGLEPWLRDRVPLIYADDKLVAVGDLWICAEYHVVAGEQGLSLSWSYSSVRASTKR